MKKYRVVVTPEAKKQMRSYLYYLKYVLKNEQAAVSVRNDYKETIRKLEMVAESIKICENPDLARKRLRKIMFRRHNYIILFRLDDRMAIILKIFHVLQDYENTFI